MVTTRVGNRHPFDFLDFLELGTPGLSPDLVVEDQKAGIGSVAI